MEFVSEEDVRRALEDDRKLPIGPATIFTPAARELGNENSVFHPCLSGLVDGTTS